MQIVIILEMEPFPFPVLCHKASPEHNQGCAVLVHPGLIEVVAFFYSEFFSSVLWWKTLGEEDSKQDHIQPLNNVRGSHKVLIVKKTQSSENPVEVLGRDIRFALKGRAHNQLPVGIWSNDLVWLLCFISIFCLICYLSV